MSAPRFQVVNCAEGVFAVEDSAITKGQIPAVAIFHPRDLMDPQQEAAALAERLNAQHDQQEAAKQRRARLHQLVDAVDDSTITWMIQDLCGKQGIKQFTDELFSGLTGTRTQ